MIIRTMNGWRRCAGPFVLLLALALVGCGGGQSQDKPAASKESVTEQATSLTPEQNAVIQKVAAVANAIEAAPATTSQVLKDANMTEEEFQAEIYRISEDPVLSRAYEEARKK